MTDQEVAEALLDISADVDALKFALIGVCRAFGERQAHVAQEIESIARWLRESADDAPHLLEIEPKLQALLSALTGSEDDGSDALWNLTSKAVH